MRVVRQSLCGETTPATRKSATVSIFPQQPRAPRARAADPFAPRKQDRRRAPLPGTPGLAPRSRDRRLPGDDDLAAPPPDPPRPDGSSPHFSIPLPEAPPLPAYAAPGPKLPGVIFSPCGSSSGRGTAKEGTTATFTGLLGEVWTSAPPRFLPVRQKKQTRASRRPQNIFDAADGA